MLDVEPLGKFKYSDSFRFVCQDGEWRLTHYNAVWLHGDGLKASSFRKRPNSRKLHLEYRDGTDYRQVEHKNTASEEAVQAACAQARADMERAVGPGDSDGGVSVLFVKGWLRVGVDEARVAAGNGVVVNKVCVRVYASQQEQKEDDACDVFHFDNSIYLRIGLGFSQVRYLEIRGREPPCVI